MKSLTDKIWFGFVEVKPINGNSALSEALGAFVNVAYKAVEEKDFRFKVNSSFEEEDFEVLNIKNIETEDNWVVDDYATSEKVQLRNDLQEGCDFSWGAFHTFD